MISNEWPTPRIINQFIKRIFNLPDNLNDKVFNLTDDVGAIDNTTTYSRTLNQLFFAYCKNPKKCNVNLEDDELYFEGRRIDKDDRMVSSCEGYIDKILLAIPRNKKDFYINQFKELFQALDKTHFYLFTEFGQNNTGNIVDKKQQDTIDAIIGKQKNRVTYIDPGRVTEFTYWIEDPFIVLLSKNNDFVVLEPGVFKSNNDIYVADQIAQNRKPDISARQARVSLIFQSGNILVGDDFVLIGKDYIELSDCYLKNCRPKADLKDFICENGDKKKRVVEALFQHIFGCDREVIVIGNDKPNLIKNIEPVRINGEEHQFYYGFGRWQPLVHIDLFITLVGKLEEKGPFVIVVGKLVNVTSHESKPFMDLYFEPFAKRLDEIANKLKSIIDSKTKKAKFDVRRIPLPVTNVRYENSNYYEWRPLCYNNCLVENAWENGLKRVFYPGFGDDVTLQGLIRDTNAEKYIDIKKISSEEKKIEDFWTKDLKFKPVRLKGFLPLMLLGGAAHCVTKYLKRVDKIS